MADRYEAELNNWINNERATLELLEKASKLQLNNSVELVLFRRKLFDKRVSEIINDHAYAVKFTGLPINVQLTLNLTAAIEKLNLAPAKIDIGRLSKEYIEDGSNPDYDAFVKTKLESLINAEPKELKPRDVVLYGFRTYWPFSSKNFD
jgi:glyceraldehyde 3-phosphate dehydrogenase